MCETQLIPTGLVIVNWSMVLVGTANNHHIHRWSFSIPPLSSFTEDLKDAAHASHFNGDSLEVDAVTWDEYFIPCGTLHFSHHLQASHLESWPLVTAPRSTLTALRASGYVILLAFSQPVWYSLFATLVLIAFLLHAVLRREEAVVHAGSEAPPWETSEVLLATIGAICQQGSHRHPDTAAARTIFMCLFILSVIMYTAFSAAFVALLSPPIHNVHHDDSSLRILRFAVGKFPVSHLMSDLLKGNLTICASKMNPHKPVLNCSFLIQGKEENSILDVEESEAVSNI
ncbi:uncharacterized protein LOC124163336 isoform X2 [Ischnura elegans]|uniref:uncharacterized protein LOC124163336 isoform X2 n=1 Tax=Ischnura elegans TaxID=197161 RepID=UPI001ED8A59F|nr:uncharacterized protein LOC124163336 isoform X2 [Ischnura elegans]